MTEVRTDPSSVGASEQADGGRTLDALAIAARHPAAPPPEVRGAIDNLLQAYAVWADRGRREELMGAFTDNATWDGREIGYGYATGPEAIADTVLAHFRPEAPMVHMPGPPLLVATSATSVDAYSWCTATRLANGRTAPVIYFAYEDTIVDRGAGWRFARRMLRLRFRESSGAA